MSGPIDMADDKWACGIGGRLLEAMPKLVRQRENEAWPILQISSETGASWYYLTGGSDARLLLKEIHERTEAESATLRASHDSLLAQVSALTAERDELRAACEDARHRLDCIVSGGHVGVECECVDCPECGKPVAECSGSECAATCQCSTCDYCLTTWMRDDLAALSRGER